MTRLPHRPVTFLLLGLVFLGTAIGSVVLHGPELRLLLSGQTITASVTAFQEVQGRRHSFQVRYHFQLQPGGPEYAHFDPATGSDVYAPVTRQAWDQALASKGLLVRYDPRDPWHNHPAASTLWTEHLVFWVAVTALQLLAALGLLGWFGVRARREPGKKTGPNR